MFVKPDSTNWRHQSLPVIGTGIIIFFNRLVSGTNRFCEDSFIKVMQSAQAIAHVQEVQCTSINPTPGNDPTDDIVSQSTAVALRSQNNAEERDIESLQRIEVQKCTEAEMQSMEEKDSIAVRINESLTARNVAPYIIGGSQQNISHSIQIMLIMIMVMMIGSSTVLLMSYILDI